MDDGEFAPPTPKEVEEYANRQHLSLSDHQLAYEQDRIAGFLRVFERLNGLYLRLHTRDTMARRHPGRDRGGTKDPYNAFVRACDVGADVGGQLAGMRVAVKDNIAVAGVPMTAGVMSDEGFVPSEDATVIERILASGGRVTAKTNIDDWGGVTRNPVNPRFHTGGSSSGSAAAVAGGLADVALGADQGGSIRIPAAWCGVVGMKPTHGLVPTSGMVGWDPTLDHIGPMTTSVADNASMLEVVAGDDRGVPQSRWASTTICDYSNAEAAGLTGVRVGVVEEALAPAGCTPGTLKTFDSTTRILREMGAEIVPVSIPLWPHAAAIWLAVVTAGLSTMGESYGQSHDYPGRIDTDLADFLARRYWSGHRLLLLEGRTVPLVFEHVRKANLGRPFNQATNLRLAVSQQIEAVLEQADVLITPTTPTGPPEIDSTPSDTLQLPDAWADPGSALFNCCALNLTGHPALSVPSGTAENSMPTGLQIIGALLDEHTVYRVGFAVEAERRSGDA